jgi:hypothetical protein
VIKGVVARIRGALLQEIQDMNVGNPALAMISLPQACPDQPVSQATRRLTGRFDQARRGSAPRPAPRSLDQLSAVKRSGVSRDRAPDHSADAFGSRPRPDPPRRRE